MLSGTVTEFSESRGLGTVVTADGRRYLFHVIEIADGSRHIDIGQAVSFRPLPRFGSLQAGTIRTIRTVRSG
jgi:cold shock CspA family protein